jgi:hypothetical protein
MRRSTPPPFHDGDTCRTPALSMKENAIFTRENPEEAGFNDR